MIINYGGFQDETIPGAALGASFRELSSLRQKMALTQEAMAEQLRISSRAYSDLERGRYAASAPTLMFLFSMLDAEAQGALVQQFMDRVQALEGTDAA